MKIGILGSGTVGQTLGKGLLAQGHDVKIGTRDVTKLDEWINLTGSKGKVGSFSDAAEFGEVIFLATHGVATKSAIDLAGKKHFEGKIVIDVTNPLDFSGGVPPKFAAVYPKSLGEDVQEWLPNSKVVKAFNTIGAAVMINPHLEEGNPDFFLAGNDEEAKKTVINIARGLGWKSFVDIGEIKNAFWLESLTMFWVTYAFKNNQWGHAFKILKK